MAAKSPSQDAGGFTAEERAAMKERAAGLRAEGKKGAKKADGLQAVLDRIAAMAPEDRVLAERVHATVTAAAPDLAPKTWYGMPAYANADGKVVVYFQEEQAWASSASPSVTVGRGGVSAGTSSAGWSPPPPPMRPPSPSAWASSWRCSWARLASGPASIIGAYSGRLVMVMTRLPSRA
jgi:hypothetical protein